MLKWLVSGGVVVFVLCSAVLAQAPPDCTIQPCTYIPLVMKSGPTVPSTPTKTATPTTTPTVTRTPTATQVPVTLLDNGDFEQDGLHWFDPANYITDTLPVAAHSGTFAIWLRGNDMNTEISRDITVPLDKPVLSYWIWIRSTEPTCGDDGGGVSFSAATPFLIDSFDLCTATATTGWVQRTVDLSAVAGQTGTLVLIAGTFDGDLTGSELLFDDIGFRP